MGAFSDIEASSIEVRGSLGILDSLWQVSNDEPPHFMLHPLPLCSISSVNLIRSTVVKPLRRHSMLYRLSHLVSSLCAVTIESSALI